MQTDMKNQERGNDEAGVQYTKRTNDEDDRYD
jgi:hypothetical protein